MGDVVNLNAYRKRQEREAIKDQAAENRVRHGRKRGAKRKAQREQERTQAQLDDKKLGPGTADATGDTSKDPKRGT